MTKIKSLLLVLALALPGLFITSGCKSTPATIAYRAEGVVITTVDSAMQAWADHVRAGLATQAQLDTVKAAYVKYYDAQLLAKAALETFAAAQTPGNQAAWDAAQGAISDAEAGLISLVRQFLTTH